MGCTLLEWKSRAERNGWTKEQFVEAIGGVCSCAYHWGIHTADKGFIPFQNKRGEYANEEKAIKP